MTKPGRPRLDSPPTVIRLTVRLYGGELQWLADTPARLRSAAVKAALRTGQPPTLAEIYAIEDDDALDDLIL